MKLWEIYDSGNQKIGNQVKMDLIADQISNLTSSFYILR
jgi:hypothetical protein